MNVKNAGSPLKEKKVKKKTGSVPVPTVATSTRDQKTKAKPFFKLPSQTDMLKDPMKYVGVAVKAFQGLNEQVEKQGEAIIQIAKHMQINDEKLAPLINAIEKANAASAQAQPSGTVVPPQGGTGSLMEYLPMLLGGGGGESETDKWLKNVGRDTIGLSNLLFKSMIQEMVPGVLDKWAARKKELAAGK